MDFKHLQSFESVVRLLSFSKAADELYISQPTISQHIQQLEDELKTRLIIRTTKSIEITPKGKEAYDYAVSILALRNRLVEDCSVESKHVIHIGASTIPAGYILPEIIPEYQKLHPDVRIYLSQGDSIEITEKLLNSTIDIGLIGMDPQNEHIVTIPFAEDAMVIITPSDSNFRKLKENENSSLAELAKQPFIFREEGSGSRIAAETALKTAGIPIRALRVIATVHDQEAIRNLVACGQGISVVSERAARRYHSDSGIITFPHVLSGYKRRLCVIYRREYLLKSFSKDFITFLTSWYKNTARNEKTPANDCF